MVSRLSGATQKAIIDALAVDTATLADLEALTGKGYSTLSSCLAGLLKARVVHIAGWLITPGAGREARIYGLGDHPDKPRPQFGKRRKEQQRESSRRNYLVRKLRKAPANPWTGLVPIVDRKGAEKKPRASRG